MQYHIVYDAEGVIRSQMGNVNAEQTAAHDARVLAKWPGGGILVSEVAADPATQMVVDGQLAAVPASPQLLTVAEFVARFTDAEKVGIMHTPELTPLALAVLTAPNGVDVADQTAQQARFALEAAGWSQDRLDAIFALPA